MSTSSRTSQLQADRQPGKPPMLQVEATGGAPCWAAEHRDALRALLVEHGSLLVRGLGLHDAAETEAVFRQLGGLMTEREAFAPRRSFAQGVYSSSKWPPNQPRSEERRVGKECRSRWSPEHDKEDGTTCES